MAEQENLGSIENHKSKKRIIRNIKSDILNLLKESTFGLNISQIADKLDLSRNTVMNYIERLEKESIVSTEFKGRSKICHLKNRIKSDILNLLEESTFGLNIEQIADKLDLSRNTVMNCIESLEKESSVSTEFVGRSKICHLKKKEMLELVDLRKFLSEYLGSFFKAVENVVAPPSSLIKQIGREMGRYVEWSPVELPNSNDLSKLERIAQVIFGFFKEFNKYGNEFANFFEGEIVPNPDDSSSSMVIRVKHPVFNFGGTKFFYQLSAGLYEQHLQQNFGEDVYLDVLKIQPENSVAYYKLGIKDNK